MDDEQKTKNNIKRKVPINFAFNFTRCAFINSLLNDLTCGSLGILVILLLWSFCVVFRNTGKF